MGTFKHRKIDYGNRLFLRFSRLQLFRKDFPHGIRLVAARISKQTIIFVNSFYMNAKRKRHTENGMSFSWRREIFCCFATKRRRSLLPDNLLNFFNFRSSREPLIPQGFKRLFVFATKKGRHKSFLFSWRRERDLNHINPFTVPLK